MEVLEIINLRSLELDREKLVENLLGEVADKASQEGIRLELYRHASLGTDLSIHLHRPVELGGAEACPLALRLAAALRENGKVSHSVWSLATSISTMSATSPSRSTT